MPMSVQKILKTIKEKLKKKQIITLSREELQIYFNYRLKNLVDQKKVLVYDELKYLMGETGPGNLRIDPQLLSTLTKETTFASSTTNDPALKLLKNKKKAEEYIQKNIHSEKTNEMLVQLISHFIKEIKILKENPLIIQGIFESTPVTCLINNGEWIYPEEKIFSFLKKVKADSSFPIIIAKKISGLLFPVFKSLFILGLTTYRTYMPEEGLKIITLVKSDEDTIFNIKYNDQFEFLTSEHVKNPDHEWEGDTLKFFFKKTLPNNIENYHNNFLDSKYTIRDNFSETVSQFRKNVIMKKIVENFKLREGLITKATY